MPLDAASYEPHDPKGILPVLIATDQFFDSQERWMQNDYFEGRQFCLLGGMAFATGKGSSFYDDATNPVYQCLVAALAGQYPDVADWNDAPERTFTDIKNLLARAIEARKAKLMETVG